MAAPKKQWVYIRPGANLPGRPIHAPVLAFVRKLAIFHGHPLTIICGTNHLQWVQGSHPPRQSQHWTGDAADIGPYSGTGPGHIDPRLTLLGHQALILAGAPRAWTLKQTGGFWTPRGVNIGFNTGIGGNHYNHLHVGLTRLPLGLGSSPVPLPVGENVGAQKPPEPPPPPKLPSRVRLNKPWDHLMTALDPELHEKTVDTRSLGRTIRGRVK